MPLLFCSLSNAPNDGNSLETNSTMPTKGKHNQSSRCDGGSSTIIVPPLPPPSKSPATSRQLRLPLPTSSAALSLSSTIEDGGRSSSHHRSTLSTHTHQQHAIELSASEQHQRPKKRGRKNDDTIDNHGIGNQGNFYTHVVEEATKLAATISSNYQPHSAPETWTPGAQKAERKVFNSSNVNVKGGIRHVPIVDGAKSQRRLYKAMQIKKRIKANPQKESDFNKCYDLAIQTSDQFRQEHVSNEGVAFWAMSNENKEKIAIIDATMRQHPTENFGRSYKSPDPSTYYTQQFGRDVCFANGSAGLEAISLLGDGPLTKSLPNYSCHNDA
eukprot:CAMPEP_0113399068 /NCGR_PEP_ID=MMETSP0013_2-20120614/15327_1 /TAXON_ID=2843 ORGANISM="Skeletonema costatum, Strain 1716" /NCGR_SAMPLE_ID=MMETSP0013_2 /ASSEMBLY_ACC=CAM_ASM_000158 /LENGTH=327 /DNA_ID=CAMNT_0000283915 /DNA_START=775 /DNA_END=1758 /DNA_ORIENTATION=+ /assembly_acc=CAM_ASM_000158